jgi:hypothetical protein
MPEPTSDPTTSDNLPAPPRRVRLTPRGAWSVLLPLAIAGVWVAAGLVAGHVRATRAAALAALKSSGRGTPARVTAVWVPLRAMPKEGDPGRMSYVYEVDGQTYYFESDVSYGETAYLRPGNTFRVTYLPDDPATHHVGPIEPATELNQGEGPYVVRLLFGALLFALVMVTVGALLPWLGFCLRLGPLRFYRHWRLARHGIAATATVTAVRAHPLGFADRVTYSYRPVDGQPLGIPAVRSDPQAANLQVGSTFLVLYDRLRPKRHILYDGLLPLGLRVVDGTAVSTPRSAR